ncbi:ATP-dependent DNA helicase DDX11 isoform X1 [Schistocerca piceifrons]|uniref:ATP-dependent DNA helicase DDX11 isoform X1 n=2 Tax=Schistocerca piceifrons TaxID=274613 RepID=UPI001F5FE2CE|nr:ATP-dependent DNA helicase DDX11 isoform X1 [Schistocerca piceifrons]
MELKPPDSFPFPFTAYSIQHDFMTNLYEALESGRLGIFESPTGTGKSLSLICGALRWLLDHETRCQADLEAQMAALTLQLEELEAENAVDWLGQQAQGVELRNKLNVIARQLSSIHKREEKLHSLRNNVKKEAKNTDKKSCQRSEESPSVPAMRDLVTDEDEILLEEYEESNCEDGTTDVTEDEEDEENQLDEPKPTQIYFCSRTHSQLAQVVGEIRRSPYGADIRAVPLASRSNCCINESVRRLGNNTLINERCLELQSKTKSKPIDKENAPKRQKTVGGGSCPFRQRERVQQLRDTALSSVHDVEELVTAGKMLKACPYYAARDAVPLAQVVLIPYNTLLHKSTREASGIRLKDSIVIIDEAHNLLESVNSIHSCEVTGHQLSFAHSQLSQYRQRFLRQFSPVNLLRLEQLIFVISKLLRLLGGRPGHHPDVSTGLRAAEEKMYTLTDFLLFAEIDNINPYVLLQFCKKSKLAHKIRRYGELYESTVKIHPEKKGGLKALLSEMVHASSKNGIKGKVAAEQTPLQNTVRKETSFGNPLPSIVSFVEALTTKSDDGRVLVSINTVLGKGRLRFMLLNPAAHIEPIIKLPRCVIVAGGTMQPISEFRNRLFLAAGGSPERVMQFSCGHIIPQESILPIAVTCGPSGAELDFSYQHREKHDLMQDLGRILVNVCNIVPAGVVCFFPSYDYESKIYAFLKENGFIEKIQQRKQVFREPKTSGAIDKVLDDYALCIKKASTGGGRGGALMLSVVGGKLSEGLNFNDDLGRCVIVVGLPYPNIKSPEMQEKMIYLDTNEGKGAGREYYESLCMKAVNQSVGRSVRHRGDYAAVLLLDRRYGSGHVQGGLPAWVRVVLQTSDRFGHVLSQLCKFFVAQAAKAERL